MDERNAIRWAEDSPDDPIDGPTDEELVAALLERRRLELAELSDLNEVA